MHALPTAVMRHSDEFTRNRAHYEQLVADLWKHLAWSQAGGQPTRWRFTSNAAS